MTCCIRGICHNLICGTLTYAICHVATCEFPSYMWHFACDMWHVISVNMWFFHLICDTLREQCDMWPVQYVNLWGCHLICDTLHVQCDMWHVQYVNLCYMWHFACDMWQMQSVTEQLVRCTLHLPALQLSFASSCSCHLTIPVTPGILYVTFCVWYLSQKNKLVFLHYATALVGLHLFLPSLYHLIILPSYHLTIRVTPDILYVTLCILLQLMLVCLSLCHLTLYVTSLSHLTIFTIRVTSDILFVTLCDIWRVHLLVCVPVPSLPCKWPPCDILPYEWHLICDIVWYSTLCNCNCILLFHLLLSPNHQPPIFPFRQPQIPKPMSQVPCFGFQ